MIKFCSFIQRSALEDEIRRENKVLQSEKSSLMIIMLQHYSKMIQKNNFQKSRIEAGPNCESIHQHGVDQLRVRREERHLRRTKKFGRPSSGTYLVQSK